MYLSTTVNSYWCWQGLWLQLVLPESELALQLGQGSFLMKCLMLTTFNFDNKQLADSINARKYLDENSPSKEGNSMSHQEVRHQSRSRHFKGVSFVEHYIIYKWSQTTNGATPAFRAPYKREHTKRCFCQRQTPESDKKYAWHWSTEDSKKAYAMPYTKCHILAQVRNNMRHSTISSERIFRGLDQSEVTQY
jgi:hypothetical protein